MTPKKTPTLVQLRKLAKRKGQDIVFDLYVLKLCQYGTWWLKIVFGPLNILTGGTMVRTESEARTVLFAALLALPDKGAKR